MKWSLLQLNKIQKFPYEFNSEFNFKEDIKDVEDIFDIDIVKVQGLIYRLDDETYRFKYVIKTTLTLQCALTLEPVEYEFENEYDEVYSTEENDDFFLIENNTINLDEIVWSNIIIDKPINVSRPDAYEILAKRGIILGEEPKLDASEAVISYSDGKLEENDI